jgi:hypothetical protein
MALSSATGEALQPAAVAASVDSSLAVEERLIGGLPASLVDTAQARPGRRVCIIGGRTGVGKTRVLLALREMGEQVIDLEGLARHRGSAFGWVGNQWEGRGVSELADQPSTEQFGNELALAWRAANRAPLASSGERGGGPDAVAGARQREERGWLFLEDEDTHIGAVTLPAGIYACMRCAPLVVRVNIGEAARIQLLIDDYASPAARGADERAWLERMQDSVSRLGKRLGGAAVNTLKAALSDGHYETVARQLIAYYDKLYDAHVLNGSGSGSGTGARPGTVVDVAQSEELAELDAKLVARCVLERVAEFEAQQARIEDASSTSTLNAK